MENDVETGIGFRFWRENFLEKRGQCRPHTSVLAPEADEGVDQLGNCKRRSQVSPSPLRILDRILHDIWKIMKSILAALRCLRERLERVLTSWQISKEDPKSSGFRLAIPPQWYGVATGSFNRALIQNFMRLTDDLDSLHVYFPSYACCKSAPHEMTLRSDALALGFKGFNDCFDCKRTLVVVVKSPKDADTVSISFLHTEGMALLLGIGVPFSKVVLNTRRSDGSIEVQEVGETAWRALWISSSIAVGSLAICDTSAGIKHLSEEAEGSDGGEIDSVLSARNQQLQLLPVFGLQRFHFPLSAAGHRLGLIAPPGSRTAKTSQTSETSGSLNDDQTSGSRIGGAERVAAAEENLLSIGKESQKLQLTVRVRLNPDDFSLDDERYRAELQTHTMEPVLTISFHKNEEGEKFFKTTLSLTYCLDANVKELGDPTRFGWFHDNLQMSFKCLEGTAVFIESVNEYLGGEARPEPQSSTKPEQAEAEPQTKSISGTLKATVGYDGASIGGALSRNQQKTDNIGATQRMTPFPDRWFVKNTSFAIIPQGGCVEIACLAHHIDDFDDPSPSTSIFNSGRIRRVSLLAEGEWKITDNENRTESERCQYQFTGRRTLHKVVQNEKVTRTSHFPWKGKSTVREERNVTQMVDKKFIIDHSFSNDWYTLYDWYLGSHPDHPLK